MISIYLVILFRFNRTKSIFIDIFSYTTSPLKRDLDYLEIMAGLPKICFGELVVTMKRALEVEKEE